MPQPFSVPEECQVLCGEISKTVDQDVLAVPPSRKSFDGRYKARATIGVMLRGTKIDSLVVGGPAFSCGKSLDQSSECFRGHLLMQTERICASVLLIIDTLQTEHRCLNNVGEGPSFSCVPLSRAITSTEEESRSGPCRMCCVLFVRPFKGDAMVIHGIRIHENFHHQNIKISLTGTSLTNRATMQVLLQKETKL